MKRSLLLLLLLPVVAQAQSRPRARTTPRAPAPATRCTDSLTGARWRSTPLSAAVTLPEAGERDRDRYVDALMRRLVDGYQDPSASLRAGGGMTSMATEEERTAIHGTVELALDRNGRVLDARMTASTGVAVLDSAILAAARGADHGRGYGKAPRKLRGDTLHFTIAVGDRGLPPRAVSLGTLSSSYLEADIPPRILVMPPARAPRGRRGRQVMLAATVTKTGTILPASIRVVSTNDSTLIPIARASLERTTYRPGTRNGCPAESYIRQNFPF